MVPLSALVIVIVQLWHSEPAYAQYYCGGNCIPCCPDAQEFVTAPEATAFNQLHTVCAWATQYIQFPASASNFGQCGTLTTCVLGSNFQTTAPTHTSDHVCNIVTQCTQGISFQTTLPTLTSNQVCSPVTPCIVGVNYQSVAPTLTTDQQCDNVVTNCTLGQTWQSVAPTATSNRLCSPVTQCLINLT